MLRGGQQETLETKAFSADIKSIYDRGALFFTKHNLQRLAEQLDKCKDGSLKENKFRVQNMLGEEVEIAADPNELTIWMDDRCDHGDRRKGPYLYYRFIQAMTDHWDMDHFDRAQAYLPVVPMYPHPRPCHNCNKRKIKFSTVPEPPTLSAMQTIQQFNLKRQEWEASNAYQSLRETLKLHRPLFSNVQKVIAFGCGPLASGSEISNYSTTQHALVLSLQTLISKSKATKTGIAGVVQSLQKSLTKKDTPVKITVQCFAQDPAYTALDEQVIKSTGITILEDPRAFLEVDETSVVLSIGPNMPVQQIIADIGRPALIIQMNTGSITDPPSPRVKKMFEEEYEELVHLYHGDLRNASVYGRKPVS